MSINVRLLVALLVIVMTASACAVSKTDSPIKIALLAPFEGRYREIGYDAFYAARLAVQESGMGNMELLAVDDGGSVASAVDRARAIARDPLVRAVVVLGYDAAHESVQQAFGNLPVFIAGNWQTTAQSDNVFIVSHPDIPAMLSYSGRLDVTEAARVEAPFVGGDVFTLTGFVRLRDDLQGITVVSSGCIPDAAFRQKYLDSAEFAPEPGLLAVVVYKILRIVIKNNTNPIEEKTNNYLTSAPINIFTFNNRRLTTPN